jgi:hypothetical protein
MEIKVVDLGCEKCHKKIKRVLCAIPRESFFFLFKNSARFELFLLPKEVTKFCGFDDVN